jgi:folate-binding protein YgfZ
MKIFNPDRQLYGKARSETVIVRLHRGLVRASGADRLDLLHRLSTNTTRDLKPLEETTTILTSDKGRIVEVVRVLAFDDYVLLLLNNQDTAGALAFLDKYTIMDDFTPADVSTEYAVFGLYGAESRSIVSALMGGAVPNAGAIERVELDGGEVIILRDARLNGTSGFLLIVSATFADALLQQLHGAGVAEIDEETYQTLRIESGIPAYGSELNEQYNPLEAGLSTLINWTKGCYIGQEIIARLDTYDKVQRHLVGLLLDNAPDTDTVAPLELVSDEGKKVGVMTSAAHSPGMDRTIALAYVRTQYAIPGARLQVVTAGDDSQQVGNATITKLPFDL